MLQVVYPLIDAFQVRCTDEHVSADKSLPALEFRSGDCSHLQRSLQTPGESRTKIRWQMSSLDLLSEMPVVNSFRENRRTENEI